MLLATLMCRYVSPTSSGPEKTVSHLIFSQNVYAPEEDPELTVERYTRSFEQNDELGLNDMKVEGYQEEQS